MNEIPFPERSSEGLVLVIGAAVLDMVGVMKEAAHPGASNPANIRASFGGVGRNVAENLARLGQPVQLVTAVGSDRMGSELLAYTAACGVDVHACLVNDAWPTGSYLVALDSSGARYVALEDMNVLSALTPDHILKIEEAANASLIFVDANLPPNTLETVVQLAQRANVPLCADATSSLLAERLLPYLESLYMISANSAEASVLCQQSPVVTDQESAALAARTLVNNGVQLAVITLAEFGVVYATSETSGHIPALATTVLDPTGAGDALVATLIFGLLNSIPIDEAVRLGVTAASLILRHRGTVLPGLSLEKLYDELVI